MRHHLKATSTDFGFANVFHWGTESFQVNRANESCSARVNEAPRRSKAFQFAYRRNEEASLASLSGNSRQHEISDANYAGCYSEKMKSKESVGLRRRGISAILLTLLTVSSFLTHAVQAAEAPKLAPRAGRGMSGDSTTPLRTLALDCESCVLSGGRARSTFEAPFLPASIPTNAAILAYSGRVEGARQPRLAGTPSFTSRGRAPPASY